MEDYFGYTYCMFVKHPRISTLIFVSILVKGPIKGPMAWGPLGSSSYLFRGVAKSPEAIEPPESEKKKQKAKGEGGRAFRKAL